jgi:hypothetical protein
MMNKYYSLLIVIGLLGCKPIETKTEVYSVLYDTTDSLRANPNVEEFVRIMDIDNADKTILCRYAEISDVDFNRVTELIRPSQKTGLFANQVQEKQKRQLFEKELRAAFKSKDSLIPTQYSSVFEPILAELRYLETLPIEYPKRLIIYSDLMENSRYGLSFYRYRDLNLLYSNPEKVVEQFLKSVDTLPKVSNLRIYIVYIPKDNADNMRFKKLQEVYRRIFKDEMGIPISFSANLTNAQNKL